MAAEAEVLLPVVAVEEAATVVVEAAAVEAAAVEAVGTRVDLVVEAAGEIGRAHV